MEEKIENLANFAIFINQTSTDIYDYYIALSEYCCSNVDTEITDDFNDIVGITGGAAIVLIKIGMKLLEEEYKRTKNAEILTKIASYEEKYINRLAEFKQIAAKQRRI